MTLTAQKKKRNIHEKRRSGRHHKQTPDYHKPYWPYIPIGIIIGLGVLVNSFWGVVQQAVLGYATNTTVSGLVEETNAQRVGGSLGGLALNSKLNAAAQAKASDMAARNYWSHNTPEGNPPWVFFANAGYDYEAAGENLAYGFSNSNSTVVAWMNSPGHRANIMNTNFTEVGFGIANVENYQNSGQQTIVVAMYGKPVGAPAPVAAAPTSEPPAQSEPAAAPAREEPAPAPVSQPTPVPAETNSTPSPETAAIPEVVVASEAEVAAGSQRVARLQLFTDTAAPWTLFAISALATVAVAAVLFRHSLTWRRTLIKGEKFILRHKYLDIALVLVGVLGFILTRTAGSIH